METPKKLPLDIMGRHTTPEQWGKYQEDLRKHIERCDRNIYLHKTDAEFNAWEKVRFMDAPNPPGYTRANND